MKQIYFRIRKSLLRRNTCCLVDIKHNCQALEKINEVQLPPNPNELDMIWRKDIFLYDVTGCRPVAGIGCLKLRLAYTSWWARFKILYAASMAPEAPKV